MSHPILGLELGEAEKRALQFIMHVGDSPEHYALDMAAFFATQWRNPSVLLAIAERIARIGPTGEG